MPESSWRQDTSDSVLHDLEKGYNCSWFGGRYATIKFLPYIYFNWSSTTYPFVVRKITWKLRKQSSKEKNRLRETVDIDHKYKGLKISIGGYEMKVYLIPLELHDFDVILGID